MKGQNWSPTIATESVFLQVAIAAKEGRRVKNIDIPSAIVQMDLKDERLHVRFEECMANMLVMIDPKLYRPHFLIESGEHVLHVDL